MKRLKCVYLETITDFHKYKGRNAVIHTLNPITMTSEMFDQIAEGRIKSVKESIIDLQHEVRNMDKRVEELKESNSDVNNQIGIIQSNKNDLLLRISNLEKVKNDLELYYDIVRNVQFEA